MARTNRRQPPTDASEAVLLRWAADVLGVALESLVVTGIDLQLDLSFGIPDTRTGHIDTPYRLRLTSSHHAYWNSELPAAKSRVMLHENGLWATRQKAAANLYAGEDGSVALPHVDPNVIRQVTERRHLAVEREKASVGEPD